MRIIRFNSFLREKVNVANKTLRQIFEEDLPDIIEIDINLLIRILEIAREDIDSDDDLHEMVERIRRAALNVGTLTIDDIERIEK